MRLTQDTLTCFLMPKSLPEFVLGHPNKGLCRHPVSTRMNRPESSLRGSFASGSLGRLGILKPIKKFIVLRQHRSHRIPPLKGCSRIIKNGSMKESRVFHWVTTAGIAGCHAVL